MKFKFLSNLGLSMMVVAMISACGGGGSSSNDQVNNLSDTLNEINNTIAEVNNTSEEVEEEEIVEIPEEVVEEINETLPPIDNNFTLTSTSFKDGKRIPSINVCMELGGSNQSPQLSWSDAPANTKKYAIVMDDEVSPCGKGDGACKHWGLFNIPSSITEVSEDLEIATIEGTVEGRNYVGTQDYEGPCPPFKHTYKTTVFALDGTMPTIGRTSMTRSQFKSTYKTHILDSVTISGTFP